MSGLSPSQVASASGVHRETLRYYERRGLLAEPVRSLGGHRLYPAEAVTVVRVIKAAQRLGFSLDEAAELIDVGRHRHGQRSRGLQDRTAAKLAEVEQKIRDLELIRSSLQQAVEAGCDDLIACAGSDCCPIPFVEVARPTAEPST